ncbi:hypothetical protein ES708_22657 [subsurface metagenome]
MGTQLRPTVISCRGKTHTVGLVTFDLFLSFSRFPVYCLGDLLDAFLYATGRHVHCIDRFINLARLGVFNGILKSDFHRV